MGCKINSYNHKRKGTLENYLKKIFTEGSKPSIEDVINNIKLFIDGSIGNEKNLSYLKEDLIDIITKSKIDETSKKNILDELKNKKLEDLYKKDNDDQDLSQSETEVDDGSKEPTNSNEEDPEVYRLRMTLNEVENEFYGTVNKAKDYRAKRFRFDLITHCIIDVNNKKIVLNNEDLNKSICKLKNKYYQVIFEFLKHKDVIKADTSNLYNKQYEFNSSFYKKYMRLFYQYVLQLKSDPNNDYDILDEYRKSVLDGNSELLEALNAYINLQYFDQNLKIAIGQAITVKDKDDFGTELEQPLDKYTFSSEDTHKVKNWNEDATFKDACKSISNFSKLIIETTPMFDYEEDIDMKTNITIQDFTLVMSKLMYNVEQMFISNNDTKKLTDVIIKFHDDPQYYARKLFDYLTNEKGRLRDDIIKGLRGIGFNKRELNILYSIAKYIYKDIYDIENGKVNEKGSFKSIQTVSSRYSIVESITGVIDRIMDATYVQMVFSSKDNDIIVSEKKKTRDRRNQYTIINSINVHLQTMPQSERKKILFESVDEKGNGIGQLIYTQQIKNVGLCLNVKIGNFTLVAKSSNKQNNLLDSNSLNIEIIDDKGNNVINEIKSYVQGGRRTLKLSDKDTVKKMLSNNEQGDAYFKLFKGLLKFIDNHLKTDFLSEDGLIKLDIYRQICNNPNNFFLNQIIQSACKAATANIVYYKANEYLKSNKKPGTIDNKIDAIRQVYPPLQGVNKYNLNQYLQTSEFDVRLTPVRSSDEWIDDMDIAEQALFGESTSSTIKNLEGNSIANTKTSYLGGNIRYYIDKHTSLNGNENQENSANKLLFSRNPKLIGKPVFNLEAKSRMRIVKQVKSQRSPELFYQNIVYGFYNSYLTDNTKKGNTQGKIIIQPTTYSDKTAFLQYSINASKNINMVFYDDNGQIDLDLQKKTLWDLNAEETEKLYFHTIGGMYKQMYNNVLSDLRKVLNLEADANEITINKKLHEKTGEQLRRDAHAKGIKLSNIHFREGKNGCSLNETLWYFVHNVYGSVDQLRSRIEKEKVDFVNDLLENNVNFRLYTIFDKNGSNTSSINKIITKFYENDSSGLEQFNKQWISDNKLIIAKIIDGNGKVVKSIQSGSNIKLEQGQRVKLNPLLEKYFYLESLLSNNLRFELTGTECAHPLMMKANFTSQIIKGGFNIENRPDYFQVLKLKNDAQPNELFVTNIPNFKFNTINENIAGNVNKASTTITRDGYTGSITITAMKDENLNYTGNYKVEYSPNASEDLKSIDVSQFIPKGATFESSNGSALRISNQNVYKFSNSNKYYNVKLSDKFNDLIWVSQQPELKNIYEEQSRLIENNLQLTQLKRNVIIPATLQYDQQRVLNGIPKKMKVAIIKDTKAQMFNFRGETSDSDVHDGSAFQLGVTSILENGSLQDQEVGTDKKPIWHSYNSRLGFSTLLKFATFAMTNERIRESLRSDISLYSLFRRMTDQYWGDDVDLCDEQADGNFIDFKQNILQGRELFYKDGDGKHYKITDLDKDEKNGLYYTIETKVLPSGVETPSKFRVYHLFDSKGNHRRYRVYLGSEESLKEEKKIHNAEQIENLNRDKQNGFTTINSVFKLHSVLGGIYSEEKSDKGLQYTEASNYALANYMNNVTVRTNEEIKNGEYLVKSQKYFRQPLKEVIIHYAANSTSVKTGAENINAKNAWTDDDVELMYTELDSDGLGTQQDTDHDIEESEITEFSQVIAALEAGGRLHEYVTEIYDALGSLACSASSEKLDAVAQYIATKKYGGDLIKVKQELYQIIGREVCANYREIEGRYDLTSSIINEIKRKFNIGNSQTENDMLLPFSDNSIYKQAISTFTSQFNANSIKRKYPGSGCVMVPSYGIIQTYKYDGKVKQFEDVLDEARQWIKEEQKKPKEEQDKEFESYQFNSKEESVIEYNKRIVEIFLKRKQKELYKTQSSFNVEEFIPTDIVDVIDENGNLLATVKLNNIDDYYKFKDEGGRRKFLNEEYKVPTNIKVKYCMNITSPRDLAPARITWEYQYGGITHKMNIFDTEQVRNSFLHKDDVNFDHKEQRKKIQQLFDNLARGVYIDEKGNEYKIFNLQNEAAELIMSNLYGQEFQTRGKSLAKIMDKGADFFKNKELGLVGGKNFDFVLTSDSKRIKYFTFKKPKVNDELYSSIPQSWENISINKTSKEVYATSKNGQKLFKIGKCVINRNLTVDENGNILRNGKEIPKDKYSYYKIIDGEVYNYYEYISKYKSFEIRNYGSTQKVIGFNVYYINTENIKRAIGDNNIDISKQIASIVSKIYNTGGYNGIQISNTMFADSANWLKTIVCDDNVNVNLTIPNDLKDHLKDVLNNVFGDVKNEIKKDSTGKDIILPFTLDNDKKRLYKEKLSNYKNSKAEEIFTSFKKSLYFTSSRIPAQTLQSFMQMKVVGFTQTSKNVAYVSAWQTWLQGSKINNN